MPMFTLPKQQAWPLSLCINGGGEGGGGGGGQKEKAMIGDHLIYVESTLC